MGLNTSNTYLQNYEYFEFLISFPFPYFLSHFIPFLNLVTSSFLFSHNKVIQMSNYYRWHFSYFVLSIFSPLNLLLYSHIFIFSWLLFLDISFSHSFFPSLFLSFLCLHGTFSISNTFFLLLILFTFIFSLYITS